MWHVIASAVQGAAAASFVGTRRAALSRLSGAWGTIPVVKLAPSAVPAPHCLRDSLHLLRRALRWSLPAAAVLLTACGSAGHNSPAAVAPSATISVPATVAAVFATAAPPPLLRGGLPAATPDVPGAAPLLCLVDRDRSIPATYVPPDLVTLPQGPTVGPAVLMRRVPAEAIVQLLDGAQAQRIYLTAISGFRSYELQQQTLAQEIRQYGDQKAHSEVADPGHSEHQLGVALDVAASRDPTNLDQTFGDTPEGRWLTANAPVYGFVISYPKGKEAITGYAYEPWHIRYVGAPLAQQIVASGQTLTEYLPSHGLADCTVQAGD